MRTSAQPPDGFTLIEMLVVIAIIVLLAGLSVPGITQLFRSGADAQAYNLLSAQINGARTYAMQNSCYTCLHLQVATGPGTIDPQTTVGILFVWNPALSKFGLWNPTTNLATGFDVQAYPGHYAFGQASTAYLGSSAAPYLAQVANTQGANGLATSGNPVTSGSPCDFDATQTTDPRLDRRKLNLAAPWFTSVNIIFTPLGNITTTIAGQTKFLFDTSTGMPFRSCPISGASPAVLTIPGTYPAGTGVVLSNIVGVTGVTPGVTYYLWPTGLTTYNIYNNSALANGGVPGRIATGVSTGGTATVSVAGYLGGYTFYFNGWNGNAAQSILEATTANSRWDLSTGKVSTDGFCGVNALTMFSMTDANGSIKTFPPTQASLTTEFRAFMNESGQLIPLNIYTAQPLPRK